MSLSVALTGGTGGLGAAVLRELLARGHGVRALVRPRPDRRLDAHEHATWIEGTIDDRDALDRLVADTDAIVHVAYCAMDETPSPGRSVAEHFVQTNVAGTLGLLERATATRGSQLVFVSSLAVYGPDAYATAERARGVGACDEGTEVWPPDFYGAHKAALEKFVCAAHAQWGINASAFRAGCVLGDYPIRARNPLATVVDEALETGSIRTRTGAYVVTSDDVARILCDALGDAAVAGQVFNTFDRWLDFGSLAEPLGTILGRPVERACDPAPEPEPPLSRDRLAAWWRPDGAWTTEHRLPDLLRSLCVGSR